MGHEDTVVSQFIAISLICIAGYNFYLRSKSGKKIDLDNIELFRITEIQQDARPQKAPSSVTVKRTTKKKDEYSELQIDCMEALKAIGVKTKKERIFLLHKIFNEHNPSTVQEFISKAFC